MTSKVTLLALSNLENSQAFLESLNENFATIQTALDNTLSRDGQSPNQMLTSLDANNKRLLNLPSPVFPTDPIRLVDTAASQYLSIYTNITRTAIPTKIIGTSRFVTIEGVPYIQGTSGGPMAIQDLGGTWYQIDNTYNGGALNVRWFGAKGDGVTDDTTAIINALAALTSGGSLYFPSGTYIYNQATGQPDTIVSSNIEIYGDGPKSLFVTAGPGGVTPNSYGNQNTRVFSSYTVARSNITIRDLSFQGFVTPIALWDCSNVNIQRIQDNGLQNNASKHMRQETIYLAGCSKVKISDCTFTNSMWNIYLTSSITKCFDIIITNNIFEHTATAGNYTAQFPVGTYATGVDRLIWSGNIIKNIYSSVDNGDIATGMGYGFYAGDAVCGAISIIDNHFIFEGRSLKQAIICFGSQCSSFIVQGNTISVSAVATTAPVGIQYNYTTGGQSDLIIKGNYFNTANTTGAFCVIGGTALACSGKVSICDNIARRGYQGILITACPGVDVSITNNELTGQSYHQIYIYTPTNTLPIRKPYIAFNRLSGGAGFGIYLGSFVTEVMVICNRIVDGNTSNVGGVSAINCVSGTRGGTFIGNTMGNTSGGGGYYYQGVTQDTNTYYSILKNICYNNSFINLPTAAEFVGFYTSSPAGMYDVTKGDFFANSNLNAGSTPGWYCTATFTPALTANASSASTTITCASTTGMLAGDQVLLVKNQDVIGSGNYAQNTNLWQDSIASVTNGTQFVLTTGIPGGNGTFTAGTAYLGVQRYKAAASIAA